MSPPRSEKIMSFVPALTPSPELGYFAMAAGAAIFSLVAIIFLVRHLRTPPIAVPEKSVFGRKSGFKPSLHKDSTPHNRPEPLADGEENYLRENSMLPYSPEGAQGSSDPFLEGGTHERRSAPRRAGNPVDILLSDSQAEVEPVAGIVLDRSATGIALELWAEGDVSPGTVLSIRSRRATSDSSWVRVIVRRCERRRASWVLGCEFVRPPGVHAMMEFG
jgi:PilZ domain